MNQSIQYATGEEWSQSLIAPERLKQLGQSSTISKIGNQQGPIT